MITPSFAASHVAERGIDPAQATDQVRPTLSSQQQRIRDRYVMSTFFIMSSRAGTYQLTVGHEGTANGLAPQAGVSVLLCRLFARQTKPLPILLACNQPILGVERRACDP
jgi:hypothetical protein